MKNCANCKHSSAMDGKKMIIYDTRTNEWREWDGEKDSYLAPELYFEVGESPDGEEHHVFETASGEKEIVASGDEFQKKFEALCNECSYAIRKKWLLPKEIFESGLKYFGLENVVESMVEQEELL